MAKINGIEVKAVKTFTGHEGEKCYQGNVYYQGKKLGFWSQDAWCGPDIYDFDTSILDKAVSDYHDSFPDDYGYKDISDDLDILISSLFMLKDMEKYVKKLQKNGNKTFTFIFDDNSFVIYSSVSEFQSDEKALKNINEKERRGKRYQIIRSLSDLDIIMDKDHTAPPCLL